MCVCGGGGALVLECDANMKTVTHGRFSVCVYIQFYFGFRLK